jgi:YD repeat-containing protein
MAADQLDLTLPDDATLAARAAVDPDRELRRVANADPEAIRAVARSFATAGRDFATTLGRGERAAATIGASFTNDGAAVYGVDQHAARLPVDVRSASTRLEASSGELAKVAADLGATRAETATRVQGLQDDLTRTRQEWAARVATAGLLTPEQAARWTAERDATFPRLDGGWYGRVVGVDALVEPTGDGWVLGWFDGARWEFDAAGRLTRVSSGPNTAVAFRHDDSGRLTELIHERGRRVRLDWDDARVVAATADDGRRVEYGYDGCHRLVVVRAGGALVVGGIALSATGIGGVPGVALMTAGGAMTGTGGSMLIQKGTTGRVDLRRAPSTRRSAPSRSGAPPGSSGRESGRSCALGPRPECSTARRRSRSATTF